MKVRIETHGTREWIRVLYRMSNQVKAMIPLMLENGSEIVEQETRQYLLNKFGHESSFFKDLNARFTNFTIGTGTEYRRAVVELDLDRNPIMRYYVKGTRPHSIMPRDAQALSFEWKKAGGLSFFRHVHHPGTKPHPFMDRVGAASESKIYEMAKLLMFRTR